jgi:hypothetical protein
MKYLLYLALLSQWLLVSATTLVCESRARLPMSLSSVINDLEAEGVTHVTCACLLTSRGVTHKQRKQLLHDLFGIFGGEDESSLSALGLQPVSEMFDEEHGLVIAQPDLSTSANDVASTALACGGTIVYVPDTVDLTRGEGLFDTLAPAMERLLASEQKASLIVVIAPDIDVSSAKSYLEQSASTILASLITKKKVSTLSDVFDSVQYLQQGEDSVEDVLCGLECHCEPADAAASVASTVDIMTSFVGSLPAGADSLMMNSMALTSPKDLAAARQLGPAARTALEKAIDIVGTTSANSSGGLVTNFGDLCSAIVRQSLQDVDSAFRGKTGIAKQIRSNLKDDLYAELGDLLIDQLRLLQAASFEDFRRNLSQLKVSPALAHDMDTVVEKSIGDFAKACKRMQIPGSSSAIYAAKTEFARSLREYCSERLLAARASGAYKPAPRKGVTIGLHWLLPKPFGNDFRQEPWSVHATDNLVYVPQDKITDVSPEEVRAGTWRRKIVPSPASRDMVFMQ